VWCVCSVGLTIASVDCVTCVVRFDFLCCVWCDQFVHTVSIDCVAGVV